MYQEATLNSNYGGGIMPFKSQSQRKFMYAKHPEMAKEWEEKTPKGKLPNKVKKSAKKGKK